MYFLDPTMQGIYELLALAVALFFPLTLLTWLVIDKFFTSSDVKSQSVRHQPGRNGRNQMLVQRSRPRA